MLRDGGALTVAVVVEREASPSCILEDDPHHTFPEERLTNMALELTFVVMDRVGKFVAFLSALAGLLYLFLDRLIAGCVLLLIASLLAQLWLLGIAVQADRVEAALQEGRPLP